MSRNLRVFGASIALIVFVGITPTPRCDASARATDTDSNCDRSAIAWFKPGEFDAAVAKAKKESRLLLLKGISFGIDDAGAACATRGRW